VTDYYSILGLPQGASKDAIKKAYRRLAMQYHPDKNPAPDARQKFIEITRAYDSLLEGKKYAPTFKFKSATQKTSTARKSPGKADDEKRHEQMARRHEQMMKKFMEMKRALGTGALLEKNRKREYATINLGFASCILVFLAGIIVPVIIGQPGILILSFPLGLGFGVRLFWNTGRRKMRADMLYGNETYFSLNELREFFTADKLVPAGFSGGIGGSGFN
jgi:hypothetical protein